MAFRLFTAKTPWEAARRDVRFTSSTLGAEPDHAKHARTLRDHLDEWNAADQARRDADDAIVDANATVARLDIKLDALVRTLDRRVQLDCNGTDDPTYRKYFPEPASDIVRMSLETEIARTRKFHPVADAVGASRSVRTILEQIAAIERAGTTALKAREDAFVAAARVSLKIQTWKEAANAARRSVENALDAYAIANKLPRDYSDGFFPARPRTSKKPAGTKGADAGNGSPVATPPA